MINRAKFAKENEEVVEPRISTAKPLQMGKDTEELRYKRMDAFIHNGCSYSSALLNKMGSSSSVFGQVPGQDSSVEVHSETSAFFDLHGRALVGRVKDIEILINLKELFRLSEVSEYKFHYLGGLNILVVFYDETNTSDFVLNIHLWKDWFDTLDVWSGSRISGSTMIVWRNKKFKVWVLEELDDWKPDCLFDDEPVKDLNCTVSDQVDVEEHDGEDEHEVSEESSDEDGGSSDESDGEPPEMIGDQEVSSPEFSPPKGGNEKTNNFNVGCGLNDPVLGFSNDVESVQDPFLECGFVNKSGDTAINHVEDSGRIFSLSSCRPDFNMGRPTKGIRRPKPRNGKLFRRVISSPISD
ncbi:hypothetical protein HanLR1_Chr03g0081731 [Helianthus annuus]|nr:hypothetical protein HanLR1_Chr03g0081731 [Helianthus annuus]